MNVLTNQTLKQKLTTLRIVPRAILMLLPVFALALAPGAYAGAGHESSKAAGHGDEHAKGADHESSKSSGHGDEHGEDASHSDEHAKAEGHGDEHAAGASHGHGASGG